MGSGDAVLAWCMPNSNFPPTKAAATDPKFTEQLPELKPWYDSCSPAIWSRLVHRRSLDLFAQEIPNTIDVVTYKQKSPADALTELAAKIDDAVEEFQSAHPDWEGE